MKKQTSSEIRQLFIDYFVKHQHQAVLTSSLVPTNDATLLFTNAGMVQFKEVFLGLETRPFDKATSVQRCVRAGGKHNDLENVGQTARHHTFFEMLGNFSFGAYFKEEAIVFAWEFLTKTLEIPAEKLWVSVYKDDKESEKIWLEKLHIDPQRFSRCGEKDNFWSMGDTGPCGPCTEIFYDHGAHIPGGPPGSIDADGDRYIEIWNLVFMQFNRDIQGNLSDLPKPCVDTGMGLERISAVMQGVHNNYEIDLFQNLLKALSEIVHCRDLTHTSMRVIVDHIRSTAFLIADGITPSNEGRGYVLRRIIRRALRHGFKLGMNTPFFYRLVPALVANMGEAYPELPLAQHAIEHVLKQEEEQFIRTLEKGMRKFELAVEQAQKGVIAGQEVFQLYDTYGFPPDLTADIARERGLVLDYPGFELAMAEQRERSQQHQMFKIDQTQSLHIKGKTHFVGYETREAEGVIIALLQDNQPVHQLTEGVSGAVVLDVSPFYAESGGQVGDSGYLYVGNAIFRVLDTKKHGDVYLHLGHVMAGQIDLKMSVRAEVDQLRMATQRNHSATHLLHEALRRVLGDHVMQKGSLVNSKRLRFDFSHSQALTAEQIHAIEQLVNQQIRSNFSAQLSEGSLEEAKQKGAMALFGEKYGETVRVIQFGPFSTEVCGGTHVKRTGDIGYFKITQETACASGIRRIEAVTGKAAVIWVEAQYRQLQQISDLLKASPLEASQKVQQLLDQIKQLNKQVSQLKQALVSNDKNNAIENLQEIHGISVLIAEIPTADRNTLRQQIDQLKSAHPKLVVLLASVLDNKVVLVAGVSQSCVDKITAAELLSVVAEKIDGRGGGRPELAEGGGNDVAALPQALAYAMTFLQTKL